MKTVSSWEELAEIESNDKYKIEVDLDMRCARIIEISTGRRVMYLSTHTFYGGTSDILKDYGWDIVLVS